MKCKICNCKAELYDHAQILRKYDVSYYRCESCGCIFTENPYWLDEAYSDAITSSDIGLVSRNINFTNKLSQILPVIFPEAESYLDFGGGYGIFVRRMRDLGFDFEWYDEYCENIFACGHEKSKSHYDIVTAFELFEHLTDPVEMCKKLFDMADNIVFSTELLPKPNPLIKDWWYYSSEHGQHIFFYSAEALKKLSSYFECNYYYFEGFHIFTKKNINIKKVRMITGTSIHSKVYRFFNPVKSRVSLLSSDFEKITGRSLS